MVTRPAVIVFDVNETLSDMGPLGEAFAAEGVPAEASRTWFASILREGFAVTATGDNIAFAEIAADQLDRLLRGHGVCGPEESVERIMDALKGLDVRGLLWDRLTLGEW